MSPVTRALATMPGGPAQARRTEARGGGRAGVLLCGAGALVTAAHALAIRRGASWTSALLAGDHLFDLLFALAITWYALALGRRAGRSLLGLGDEPLAETLAALGLGLSLLTAAIFFAGILHLYHAWIFLLLGAALTAWLRADLTLVPRQAWAAVARWCGAGMPTAPTLGQRLLLFVLALTGIAWLIEATVPPGLGAPIEWDAPAYHLAAPKLYLAAHQVLPLPDIPLANAPSSQEMLYVLGLFAGSDGLGKMLHLLATLGMALATYSLARRVFDARAGWYAIFLLFGIPWLGLEVPSTLPDYTAVLLLLLGVRDLLVWGGDRGHGPVTADLPGFSRNIPCHDLSRSRHDLIRVPGSPAKQRMRLVRAGVLLGASVSFKLIELPVIPAALFLVALVPLCAPGRTFMMRIESTIRQCGVLGVAALAPLAPWLLKNLCWFGSPLYPIAVAATSDNQAPSAAAATGHISLLAHSWWLLSSLVTILWNTLGPIRIFLPAALLLRRCPIVWRSAAFLVIAGLLWRLFVPAFVEPRYYVAPLAVAAILIAGALSELMRRIPYRPALVELPLIAYLLIHGLLVLNMAVTQVLTNRALDTAAGAISRDAYLAARMRPYRPEQWANTHLPAQAVIALVDVTRSYYLDQQHLADWYGARLQRLEGSPASRRAELTSWCRAGVRYAIFNRGNELVDSANMSDIRPRAQFTWLRQPGLGARLLFSAAGIDVLAVTPCAAIR